MSTTSISTTGTSDACTKGVISVSNVVTISIDGIRTTAVEGATVAATLLGRGRRAWRTTASGEPRGVFCAIGVCFDCTLTVDGVANVRACLAEVREGMLVTTDCAS